MRRRLTRLAALAAPLALLPRLVPAQEVRWLEEPGLGVPSGSIEAASPGMYPSEGRCMIPLDHGRLAACWDEKGFKSGLEERPEIPRAPDGSSAPTSPATPSR
jgi:hypothetical protein